MELSRYDLLVIKSGAVKKSCPMSPEMSEKINEVCSVMNTDYCKATRDMWINVIMQAREQGLIDRPTVLQKASNEMFPVQDPYHRKSYPGYLTSNQ